MNPSTFFSRKTNRIEDASSLSLAILWLQSFLILFFSLHFNHPETDFRSIKIEPTWGRNLLEKSQEIALLRLSNIELTDSVSLTKWKWIWPPHKLWRRIGNNQILFESNLDDGIQLIASISKYAHMRIKSVNQSDCKQFIDDISFSLEWMATDLSMCELCVYRKRNDFQLIKSCASSNVYLYLWCLTSCSKSILVVVF